MGAHIQKEVSHLKATPLTSDTQFLEIKTFACVKLSVHRNLCIWNTVYVRVCVLCVSACVSICV